MYTIPRTVRTIVGRAASAVALLMTVNLSARAQDPVRLPGVSVIGTADKPGPRTITGIVVDTAGNVIAGAEVTIPGLERRLFSRADGTFRFDDVRPGTHSMRARKLGFAPQIRELEVDSAGGVAQFQLLPLVTALPAMVSSANKRGLSGSVADMNLKAISQASVRLLGAGLETQTDADGNFFLPAKPGRYMVSIEREGFRTKLAGVTVPNDSGRHMFAWLMPSMGPLPRDQFWIVDDLRERQAWVLPKDRVLYTREDLARMNIEWIYDAVAMNWSKFPRKEGAYSRDCRVVVNGGPDIASLATLTIDDVETVEIYNSFGRGSATVTAAASRGRGRSVRGGTFLTTGAKLTRDAVNENRTRVCPAVYVWLR